MILPKKVYSPHFFLKSFYQHFSTIISKSLFFKSTLTRKKSPFTNVRPYLTSKSKILVFDWKKVEQACPLDCISIDQENGKLKKFEFHQKKCVGCGDCIGIAPMASLEARELLPFTNTDEEVVDLIKELA